MWSPYLVWQASHGWPQLAVSRSIAAGNSGSSQPRALLLPEQVVLLSPYVAPIWITGLVRLFRDPALRWCRAIGVAYPVLAVIFVITGAKSYYLAGLFPILLGAGAQPTGDWIGRQSTRGRSIALAAGLALGAAGSVLVTLPVLPIAVLHDTPIVSLNYNGYWYWGPPRPSVTKVLAVGFTARELGRFCAVSTMSTRLDNHLHVKNQEQGDPVWFCSRLRGPWRALWPQMRVSG
jgi:hypothetical protein